MPAKRTRMFFSPVPLPIPTPLSLTVRSSWSPTRSALTSAQALSLDLLDVVDRGATALSAYFFGPRRAASSPLSAAPKGLHAGLDLRCWMPIAITSASASQKAVPVQRLSGTWLDKDFSGFSAACHLQQTPLGRCHRAVYRLR